MKAITRMISILCFCAALASPGRAQPVLVEDLDIRGYRSISREELVKRIHTQPGKPFNRKVAEKDFARVIKMAQFDKTQSKLVIERGPRNGMVVIFDLKEKQKP